MEWLIRWRKWLVLAMVGLSVVFAWFAKDTKVDFSFDSFNPAGDQETVFYKNYRRTFPHADNGILIAFENTQNPAKGIWDPVFCSKTDTDHAIQLVGYGTSDAGDAYWVCGLDVD